MKVKKYEDEVKRLLEKNKHLRDSDMKLLSCVWYYQLKTLGQNPETMSAMSFMQMIADNKLANPSSIRRCRAKVQELNIDLRGKRYSNRKKNQTINVIKEIKKW